MKECPKCGELVGDNVEKCFNCGFDFTAEAAAFHEAVAERKLLEAEKRIADNAAEVERKRIEAEKLAAQMSAISKANDFFEYDVVTVPDNSVGGTDISALKQALESHAMEGWRLVNAFTNEYGKESSTVGYGGISSSTNKTVEETVLIFERCVRRHDQ